MGCAKLRDILLKCKKSFPDVYEEMVNTDLSQFKGQRFFIEVSGLMYKYVSKCASLENGDHIKAFHSLYNKLADAEIHACFVFEGLVPAAKKWELEKRKTQRQRTKERTAVKIANMVKEVQNISPSKTETTNTSLANSTNTPPNTETTTSTDVKTDEQDEASKYLDVIKCSQILSKIMEEEKRLQREVKKEYYVQLRQSFIEKNIPFICATYEAEQSASWLMKNGFADMVVSDDYDCLICGAPAFFQHFQSASLTPRIVRLQPLLKFLGYTYDQFVDFCILLGTDFKGHLDRFGEKKARDTINQYGSLEKFIKSPEGKAVMRLEVNQLEESDFVVTKRMFVDDTFPVSEVCISGQPSAIFSDLIKRFEEERSKPIFEFAQAESVKDEPQTKDFEKVEADEKFQKREREFDDDVTNTTALKQTRLSLGKNHKRVIHL